MSIGFLDPTAESPCKVRLLLVEGLGTALEFFSHKPLDITRNARIIQVVDTPQPRLGTQGLEMKMSNYDALSLYLVSEGTVTPATTATEWDGTNSILVAASSEEGALKVADAYDRGLVQADNLAWDDETIAVVTLRDRDTGLYA